MFTTLAGNGAQKAVFCERCAVASGLFEALGGSLLSAFAGPTLLNVRDEKCQSCGITFKKFKDTGYLGCETCYTVFRTALMPIINNAQLAVKHTGKVPYTERTVSPHADEYHVLEEQLKNAIAEERYEDAGKIQCRMRELRGQ